MMMMMMMMMDERTNDRTVAVDKCLSSLLAIANDKMREQEEKKFTEEKETKSYLVALGNQVKDVFFIA
jgi:hypothetical protein